MFKEICSVTPWIEDTSRNSLTERLYCIEHNLKDFPKCEICSEKTKFSRSNNRYSKSCSEKCKNLIIKINREGTCLERYGVENPAQSEEIKEKTKETNLERYGSEYALQSEDVKDKIKQTNLERYGVENAFQSEEIKEKIKETSLKKYGVEYASQSEEVKEKIKATCQERYGVEYASQSEEVRDKISISKANNFQSRRNDNGTDYAGSVYILHFPQHKAVKIGLTGDFDQRFKSLFKTFGEYNIIDIIETPECFKLEVSLHEKFKDYRMCLDKGCGRTEFFSEDILQLL
jgi:hypothetical protein